MNPNSIRQSKGTLVYNDWAYPVTDIRLANGLIIFEAQVGPDDLRENVEATGCSLYDPEGTLVWECEDNKLDYKREGSQSVLIVQPLAISPKLCSAHH